MYRIYKIDSEDRNRRQFCGFQKGKPIFRYPGEDGYIDRKFRNYQNTKMAFNSIVLKSNFNVHENIPLAIVYRKEPRLRKIQANWGLYF